MELKGYTITELSEWDGTPIKNKLPEELKDKFKTKKQWLDEGMMVKDDAAVYLMHPIARRKPCEYYFETDVEPLKDVEVCANCKLRKMEWGRCPVMGDYVSPDGHCSEWDG